MTKPRMSNSEVTKVVELLKEHIKFEPHLKDPKMSVSKWGTIVETNRFISFAQSIIDEFQPKSKKTEMQHLMSLFKVFDVNYLRYDFKGKVYVVPCGHTRKFFESKGEQWEFIFDSQGSFIKCVLQRLDK